MTQDLRTKIRHFPEKPGVYLMKDSVGRIIYVGKANSLKKRVSSYLHSRQHPPKVAHMMTRVSAIDYLVVGSELEALMLESNLIKKYRPRYNVMLRDDKHYPYLKLTVNEVWPRLLVVRKILPDGAQYFGPYTGGAVRTTLKLVKRLFKIRWCKETPLKIRAIPCIEYHIKRCDAPCIGNIGKEEYARHAKKIALFLEGKYEDVVASLQKEMKSASGKQEFERAAILRDRIRHLEELTMGQRVLSAEGGDRDVAAYVAEAGHACLVIFQIRDGKLIHQETFYPYGDVEGDGGEAFLEVLTQYYSDLVSIPPEILVNHPLPDGELLTKLLEKKVSRRVRILCPLRGEKKSLVQLAIENARDRLVRRGADRLTREIGEALAELKNVLKLPQIPQRIEGFDISNIQGSEIVGSMVTFVDGEPYKSHYRKFKVSFTGKPDDFASMYEVVYRRYGKSLAAKLPLPDLILIDGGLGQVHAAERALENVGKGEIPIVGLAKRLEELYQPESNDPIRLPRTSSSLQLLQRVRDEAHRFAVTFHRLRRGKGMVR